MTPHIPFAIATIAPHLATSTLYISLTLTKLNQPYAYKQQDAQEHAPFLS
jgi:hypothetical protein